MEKTTRSEKLPPLIFNVFKPARAGSFDIVRHFKRNLTGDYGKIGHFGTLDPFACGVLMIGVGGAARLNELVHEYLPKTYLAVGKLGVQTDTGDWEGSTIQTDSSPYLSQVIGTFDKPFIQETLRRKFLGKYLQAPPIYSATKFQGKPLHEWARAGVEIKKEPVERTIHSLDVVRWRFPYLCVRVTASSGTYIRTLFQDAAQELGTIGSLIALQRTAVGQVSAQTALRVGHWPLKEDDQTLLAQQALKPHELLPFGIWNIPADREAAFVNGLAMRFEHSGDYAWGMSHGENWGLLKRSGAEWKVVINFRAMSLAH